MTGRKIYIEYLNCLFIIYLSIFGINMKYFVIIVGGSIGTIGRYAISNLLSKASNFSLGTLFVNVLGSFLIGALWLLSEKINMNTNLKLFLFTGLIGAFTTFSTYILESFQLFQNGEIKLALTNIVLSPIFGLLALSLGYFLSKILFNLKSYF